MYNVEKVQKALKGVIGYHQPNDPSIPALPSDLTISSSGKYMQDVHSILSIENIYNSAPEFDKYYYPEWVDKDYKKGEIVRKNNKLYQAKEPISLGMDAVPGGPTTITISEEITEMVTTTTTVDVTTLVPQPLTTEDNIPIADEGNATILLELHEISETHPVTTTETHPVTHTETHTVTVLQKWLEVNLFSDWLTKIHTAASGEVINDLIKHKKVDQATKTLIDSLKLFDGIGSFNDRIIKHDRFVGLEITLPREEGINVIIDKIGMQLDTIQDLDFYLYHSSSLSPVKKITVTFDKAGNFNWKSPDDGITLTYFDDDYDTTGVFYFGYYESDLLGQALKRSGNFTKAPCLGCSQWNYDAWVKWSQHVKLKAISVSTANLKPSKDLFDTAKVITEADSNWGLNLSLTVVCDPSAFFIKNLPIIQDALAMKIGMKLLQTIAFSTRMNYVNMQTKQLAMAELEVSQKSSFAAQYNSELKAISLDFEGLSPHCFPYENKKVISKGSI